MMDFDSSSKFIASLAKFLQSLCNGYVEFDKGVEVIGHIYLSVDSDTGKKIDYVLNEKVCKNDNSVTFISNSFHAQPAEKPKPPPKKSLEVEKRSDENIVMDDSGQTLPSSTNVGTVGVSRNLYSQHNQDGSFSPGTKRPRSPPHRKLGAKGAMSSPLSKHGMPPSPRYHDSGGSAAKISRSDIPPSPMNNNSGDDYDNSSAFQDEDDSQTYPSFLNPDDQNTSHDIDQKPIIDPDISIVKEEYMSNQGPGSYSGSSQTSGPGRGKQPTSSQAYPVMLHQNPPTYPSSSGPHSSDFYSNSSLEGAGDPSALTRAQQEELEMYYRKGTDQHLTFLRNMREAHAMYPFTGKRDKELFDKALAELLFRLPVLKHNPDLVSEYFVKTARDRKANIVRKTKGQFKSPGQGMGAKQYGRGPYPGGQQGYPFSSPVYHGRPGYSQMERRMSSTGSEGGEGYAQGEESYDYQHMASDDSRDTQQSGDGSQQQAGFHGAFGDSSQQGFDPQSESFNHEQQQTGDGNSAGGGGSSQTGEGGGNQSQSPPDIKYEVTPMPFMKPDDFELIEIDPDEDDEIQDYK